MERKQKDKTERHFRLNFTTRAERSPDAVRKTKRVSRRDLIACFTFQCYRRVSTTNRIANFSKSHRKAPTSKSDEISPPM